VWLKIIRAVGHGADEENQRLGKDWPGCICSSIVRLSDRPQRRRKEGRQLDKKTVGRQSDFASIDRNVVRQRILDDVQELLLGIRRTNRQFLQQLRY